MPGSDYTAVMFRGRSAAVAAAVAIAATAAVSAGCGGGTSSAVSLDPLAAAATKTENAGAARIRLAMTVNGQGKAMRVRGTGAMDGTSSEMTFKLGSLMGLTGLPSEARSQLGHGSLHEVALAQDGDYVVYLRLGVLASQLPGGKQWIKLDITKLGKSAGLDVGKLLSASGQIQPADLLSTLESAGAKVHKLGSARIDGAATTRYRVTIDVAKLLQSKGLTSPLLSSAAAQMKTMTENVWIGKDGLVRRIGLRYGLPVNGSPKMTMVLDIYDYGAKVDIAAPPSDQVFDATQFAQQGLGSIH
jgi:hypothetical protein